MCGLYGYSTKKGVELTEQQLKQRSNILSGLAIAMQERGTHSTGVAGVCKEHGWCMVKEAVSAREFIATKEYKEFVDHNPTMVIGHTRYATIGAINNENAHPHHQGNIIGAHNGSVSNYQDVYPKGQVDSQAIFETLNKYDNNFKKALKQLRGTFAITWFDQRISDKLHFVVDTNPLSLVRIPEIETYFWCSLKYPLEAILTSHFDMSKNAIWSPKEETVYTLDGNHQIKKKKIEFKGYEYAKSTYDPNKRSWIDIVDEKDKEDEKEEQKLLNHSLKQSTKINLLSTEDKELILEQSSECEFCQKRLDVNNDVVTWHQAEKLILCWQCTSDLKEWEDYIYLSAEDLRDIDDELWEEEEFKQQLKEYE